MNLGDNYFLPHNFPSQNSFRKLCCTIIRGGEYDYFSSACRVHDPETAVFTSLNAICFRLTAKTIQSPPNRLCEKDDSIAKKCDEKSNLIEKVRYTNFKDLGTNLKYPYGKSIRT